MGAYIGPGEEVLWVVFLVPVLWSEVLLFLEVAAYYQSVDQLLQKLGSHLTGQQNVLVVHHFLSAVVQRNLQQNHTYTILSIAELHILSLSEPHTECCL